MLDRAGRPCPSCCRQGSPSVSAPTKRSHLYTAFLASHTDGWCELWQLNRDDVLDPDFDSYIARLATHAVAPMIFEFLAGWWPLRKQPNVMSVDYADLKRDPSRRYPADR